MSLILIKIPRVVVVLVIILSLFSLLQGRPIPRFCSRRGHVNRYCGSLQDHIMEWLIHVVMVFRRTALDTRPLLSSTFHVDGLQAYSARYKTIMIIHIVMVFRRTALEAYKTIMILHVVMVFRRTALDTRPLLSSTL